MIIIIKKGLKMKKYSKQREAIINSLKNRKDHPTAEELFLDLKNKMPDIGIATIYRNLQNLYQDGEITKIKTKCGIDRYDGNIKPHIHFECIKCGNVSDIWLEDEQMKKIDNDIKILTKQIQAHQEDFSIIINGICRNCRR